MKKHKNIPIFVPHKGCPNDCVFCNQHEITGRDEGISITGVKNEIDTALASIKADASDIEIAFFGGSFTGICEDLQNELLFLANAYIKEGRISGIRLSTRPDYINNDILSRLKGYGVTTIELGIQSMDDDVLSATNRGHTSEDSRNAMELVVNAGFSCIAQMMIGLPRSSREKEIYTASEIIKNKVQGARIYPTIVIKGTRLYEMYKSGSYKPLELDEAVDSCAVIKNMFKDADVPVIRCGLMATDVIRIGDVVGPFHPSFGEMVESRIYFNKMSDICRNTKEKRIEFCVSRTELSKAIGNKKSNIKAIKKEFGVDIEVKIDSR